jgi:cyanate permease
VTFLLIWGLVIGTGFVLGCTIITDKSIVNWFIKKSGIALNTKFAIQSLSGLLLLPLIAWLVTNHGWRITCVIAGAVIAVIGSTLVWFFVRPHPPEHYGLLRDGENKQTETVGPETRSPAQTEAVEFTLKQTMKTPTYWLMISLAYISGMVMPIMGAHCIPFLTDKGISPVQAAGMMGLMTTVSVPSRLATGFIIDKIATRHMRYILMAGYFLQATGVALFLLHRTTPMIYVWFILAGLGGGISQSVNLPLWARYFGRKAYGSILGSMMAMNMPIGLAAPIFVGWIYDTTGSYMSIINWMAPLLLITGFVAYFILPPKPPEVADSARMVI